MTRNKARDLRSWRNKRTHEKQKATTKYKKGERVTCYFCRGAIDMDLYYLDRYSWTLHHIEPLNAGGHVLGTTVDAHRACNSSFGDGSRVDPLRGRTRDW